MSEGDGPWLEPAEATLRLLLFAPPHIGADFPESLGAVLDTGAAAAFILDPAGCGAGMAGTCRDICAAREVAFLALDDPVAAIDLGADGVHLRDPEATPRARTILGAARIIGVSCGMTRHAAMVAGEDGADYVLFGALDEAPVDFEQLCDLVTWWSEVFVLPVAAGGLFVMHQALELARAGIDFLAPGPAFWNEAKGPVATARELMAATASIRH